jgi:2-polyprenyl-3-methyl-5-hydroxy-6-metoxy-1,4-benzoquinol methylase
MQQANEIDLGTYKVQYGSRQQSEAMFIPLYSEEQIKKAIAELRDMLQEDASPETQAALQGETAQQIERFKGHWFQRIDYPGHHVTSTSNPSLAYIDEGGLNTLGRRLTGEEASILRPYPKWMYLKPLLPDLQGKSVLELGSSNGFFSFRFAEMGAAQVTGIEMIKHQHESAIWSRDILGHRNVDFLNTDFLVDLTIRNHDIVFLSEVHNHLLFPFYGLLRILSLANELVILDTGASPTQNHGIELSTAWKVDSGKLIYHSYHLSDGLISDFLELIGINSSKIVRYKEEGSDHFLYIIDVRERAAPDTEFMQKSLFLKFKADPQEHLNRTRNLKAQLRNTKLETVKLRGKLHQAQSRIAAMESSKFWRLRKTWFKFKQVLGIRGND